MTDDFAALSCAIRMINECKARQDLEVAAAQAAFAAGDLREARIRIGNAVELDKRMAFELSLLRVAGVSTSALFGS